MPEPVELLGLHRDIESDYAGLPAVRWHEAWSRQTVLAVTVVGALLAGFLLSVALQTGRSAAREQDVRRSELIALIEQRQAHTERLAEQLEGLRAEVADAQSRAAAGIPALRERLRGLEATAGLTGLRGPGVRITLNDAATPCATGRPEDCRIQDTDLQLVVNALFGSGAEALAVNGERLIATSAVRSAGRSILVNYTVLGAPYVVEAIGDAARLAQRFGASDVAGDFDVWKDVYGLGFSVESVDELTLPAYDGGLRLRAASVRGNAP